MKLQIDALYEKIRIIDNKQFARLAEKTQVISPKNGLNEVPKNRASHSFEVAASSIAIAINLAEKIGCNIDDIDYQVALENISLCHDIGHCAFGHQGAKFLDNILKQKGLLEGFSDNNNNLIVIKKNNIKLRDYVLASIIKYPNLLYKSQKHEYLPKLKKAIDDDKLHYQKLGINLKSMEKTIACQIMDEADRNSYVCSDLSDFLCMGVSKNIFDGKEILNISKKYRINAQQRKTIAGMVNLSRFGSKNEIKEFFSCLKMQFNQNHKLSENGIEYDNDSLFQLREFLNEISFVYYINPIRLLPEHHQDIKMFVSYIDYILNNEDYPSTFYKNAILKITDKIERLRLKRDMISEVSDWFIKKTVPLLECCREKI